MQFNLIFLDNARSLEYRDFVFPSCPNVVVTQTQLFKKEKLFMIKNIFLKPLCILSASLILLCLDTQSYAASVEAKTCKTSIKASKNKKIKRAFMKVSKACGAYQACAAKVLGSNNNVSSCRTKCATSQGGEQVQCLRNCLRKPKNNPSLNVSKKVKESCSRLIRKGKCRSQKESFWNIVSSSSQQDEVTVGCGPLFGNI